MTGLLDGLTDPALMARIDDRQRLIARLAEYGRCDFDAARIWLEVQEASAFETAQQNVAAGAVACIEAYH